MSKKETEFDRYDRMRKMERELEVQKRKNLDFLSEDSAKSKKGGKPKSSAASKQNWSKSVDFEEEYDYV